MTRSKPGNPTVRGTFLVAGIALVAVLAGCTGRGGGYLPPDGAVFTGQATLGFSFSCERSSKSTSTKAPTGQLRIELAYAEQGVTPLSAPFGIHGIADVLDPQLESGVCIGQNGPVEGDPLIFLGRYRLVSSRPAGFPTQCAVSRWTTGSNCRFEVIVKDNDLNRAPSAGDFFSIKLSTVTQVCQPTGAPPCITEFDPRTVFYARAGLLGGGNITVDY